MYKLVNFKWIVKVICLIIKDTNHFYHSKENEIGNLILNWIKNRY